MYGSGLVVVLMVFSLALPNIGGFSPQILMFRFDFLSDQEMSVLLTYVRQTFGEDGATIPTDHVARIRLEINVLN
tara:strand:+ start:1217 stop:1441 length:225 start_codon:yes stop_codon:yes gene_type:complete